MTIFSREVPFTGDITSHCLCLTPLLRNQWRGLHDRLCIQNCVRYKTMLTRGLWLKYGWLKFFFKNAPSNEYSVTLKTKRQTDRVTSHHGKKSLQTCVIEIVVWSQSVSPTAALLYPPRDPAKSTAPQPSTRHPGCGLEPLCEWLREPKGVIACTCTTGMIPCFVKLNSLQKHVCQERGADKGQGSDYVCYSVCHL